MGGLRRSVATHAIPGIAQKNGLPTAARSPLRDRKHARIPQAKRSESVGDSGSAMRSLANSLLANAETRIIYRQESDQLGITAETLDLTRTERQLLPQLTTGQGLWKIKDRAFVAQHQLHPAEYVLFDTTSRMTT